MNADSAFRSFACRWVNATADSATGGYPAVALGFRTEDFTVDGRRRVFHGGTMGFARGAPLISSDVQTCGGD